MLKEVATFAQDVELKTVTVNDVEKSVLNNRIAIYQGRERTTFINVTAWGKLAEYIAANYKKGDEVCIEGELRNGTINLEDRSVQTTYILVRSVKLTFGRKSRRAVVEDNISTEENNYNNVEEENYTADLD